MFSSTYRTPQHLIQYAGHFSSGYEGKIILQTLIADRLCFWTALSKFMSERYCS